MKIEVESLSAVKKKVLVSVPENEVLAEFDEAYVRAGRQAKIPGFRPGKAPRKLLEQRYGAAIESEVFQQLVEKSMAQAIEEHSLEAVAMPKIENPQRKPGEGFSYTASVEVKPALDPKDYKDVKVEKVKAEVTDEQISQVLERLQNDQAVLREREGAKTPLKGDYVSLLIVATNDAGERLSQEDPKEQLYEIGGEILHADMEKAVKKLTIGGSAPVSIEMKQTKDGKEEKRDLHFSVTLRAIKEKVLPKLNDDFAKSVGPFENVAALKTRVKEDLQQESAEKAKAETVQKILDALRKKNPVELPEALVHQELHNLMHNLWRELERAGIREIPAEYSEDVLHKKLHPDAERRVHEQLLIEAIARKEKIDVEDKEILDRMTTMANSARVPMNEFRAFMEKNDRIEPLRFQMLAQKTLDFLFSAAQSK